MKGFITFGLALLPASVVFVAFVAWAGAPGDLAGNYVCRGEDKGETYAIPLTVSALGDTWQFMWTDNQGNPVLAGLALPHGDYLAVALWHPKGAIGTASYRVRNGRLEGRWTKGDGHVIDETCTRGRVGDRAA